MESFQHALQRSTMAGYGRVEAVSASESIIRPLRRVSAIGERKANGGVETSLSAVHCQAAPEERQSQMCWAANRKLSHGSVYPLPRITSLLSLQGRLPFPRPYLGRTEAGLE